MADRFRSRDGAMLATGCCSLDRAQESLDLTVIITIAMLLSRWDPAL